MLKQDEFDVAIIGAGPAGMMSAIKASENGARVILLEKNKEPGKKLLITGNGRCNLTNAEFDLRKLVENYDKNGKFLFHAFYVFGPKEVIDFFNKLGIKTKVEENRRVFPASEKSEDIVNALQNQLINNSVELAFNSEVTKIVLNGNKIEKLLVGDKQITAKKYIICTGGKSYSATGSTGDGFKWAKEVGHKINEVSPALVPIKLKEDWLKEVQGLALSNVEISILSNNKRLHKEIGDVLFTHFGLSGPLILNISKKIGELLKQGNIKICLDLCPNVKNEELEKEILDKINNNHNKSIKIFLTNFAPKRFVNILLKYLEIDEDKKVNSITKTERKSLITLIKNFELEVAGLMGLDFAMVTAGGISLKEIDPKTMKSKIIDNLFFAGEVIDIDGPTGGFNLQSCWSTGHLAGTNTK